MSYPEISIELSFIFGVLVGTSITATALITTFIVANENKWKRLNKMGVFRKTDVNPDFLKTIESIEENLKKK